MAGNGTGPGFWTGVAEARPEVVNGYVQQRCGRCRALPADDVCWWCGGWLCDSCWGEVGHCGHQRADAVQEVERRALYVRRCGRANRAPR